MEAPETQYVSVGDADVAYQVVGAGDTDLLYCYGLGSHIEMFWDVPESAEYLRRLGVDAGPAFPACFAGSDRTRALSG
jgi:hypothetical protein